MPTRERAMQGEGWNAPGVGRMFANVGGMPTRERGM